MEKPASCCRCGAELEQPATGRPKRYCGEICRRAAEYELRRVEALLLEAERKEMRARAVYVCEYKDDLEIAEKRAPKFWAGEVRRLQALLDALLSSGVGA